MGSKRVVAGITVVVSGLVLAGCGWIGGSTFDDKESFGEDITELRFENGSGDVIITAGDSIEVQREVRYREEEPGKTVRVDGDVLVLDRCPVNNCVITYTVTVPAGTKVSGHANSGNVNVTGTATANVETESGDITVRDVKGDVNASAHSGTVDLSAINGAVVATARSGDVTVELATVKSISAETHSGNIDVTVPSGKYHVSVTTGSGDIDNGLSDDPSGLPIDARAKSGDVTLRAA